MIDLEELNNFIEDLETNAYYSTYEELLYKYKGYNEDCTHEDYKQFDFEINDCIFTIKYVYKDDTCYLDDYFQMYINKEWVDFKRG